MWTRRGVGRLAGAAGGSRQPRRGGGLAGGGAKQVLQTVHVNLCLLIFRFKHIKKLVVTDYGARYGAH